MSLHRVHGSTAPGWPMPRPRPSSASRVYPAWGATVNHPFGAPGGTVNRPFRALDGTVNHPFGALGGTVNRPLLAVFPCSERPEPSRQPYPQHSLRTRLGARSSVGQAFSLPIISISSLERLLHISQSSLHASPQVACTYLTATFGGSAYCFHASATPAFSASPSCSQMRKTNVIDSPFFIVCEPLPFLPVKCCSPNGLAVTRP